MKIPFARLVWLVIGNLPSRTSLSTTKKISSQTNYHFHNKLSIKSGALVKILFTRLVWLVIENLPSQTSLSTTKNVIPDKILFSQYTIYLVWCISENILRQTSLASNRKSPFQDQSINNQKISYQTIYHFHNKIAI